MKSQDCQVVGMMHMHNRGNCNVEFVRMPLLFFLF